MTEVEPRFLEKGDCQGDFTRCSLSAGDCPKFGLLLKPSRDGKRRVKGCADPVARGKRNRTKGDSKARQARKKLNIAGANTRHEELFGGAVRVEIKAGKIIAPAATAFLRCEAQSELARPIGDPRPFLAIWMPDGTSDGICAFRLSKVADVAAALYSQVLAGLIEMDEVEGGYSVRPLRPMTTATGEPCCGDAASRGCHCDYHQGWLDALEVKEHSMSEDRYSQLWDQIKDSLHRHQVWHRGTTSELACAGCDWSQPDVTNPDTPSFHKTEELKPIIVAALDALTEENERLRAAILDIDAHATPFGEDEDGFVNGGYPMAERRFKAGAYELGVSDGGLITAYSPGGLMISVKLSADDLHDFAMSCLLRTALPLPGEQ